MIAFLLGIIIVLFGAVALYLAGCVVYFVLWFVIRCIIAIFGLND